MRFLKKINRGLIVILVLVLAVCGYLIALRFIRQGDREQIKTVVDDYLSQYQSDIVLGERTCEDAVTEARKNELKYFVSESAFAPTLSVIEGIFEEQKELGTYTFCELDPTSFSSFAFDGDTATVKVRMNITLEAPQKNLDASDSSQRTRFTADSDFVLQKQDGQWKLFYFGEYLLNNAEYEDPYSVSSIDY